MYQRINGGKVLIIGDLHISDRPCVGKHKDYMTNCFSVLRDIIDMVENQHPSALVLLGDLVGTVERNLKSREVLAMVCKFFTDIKATGCRVFCVRGNHDFGDYPDFQFFASLGLFETAESCGGFFDYYGSEDKTVPEIRFHLLDYGSETRKLDIVENDVTNIVLAHNNFTIQGVTTWYDAAGGYELSSMQNFNNVYLVIAGHIHNPSPQVFSTRMMTGGTCNLFYVGSPTRPAEYHESCWVVEFEFNPSTEETDYDAKEWQLRKNEDVFYLDDTFVEEMSEEEIADATRKEQLKEVLEEIITCRIGSTDLVAQIMSIPNATEDAKRMACQYINLATNNK